MKSPTSLFARSFTMVYGMQLTIAEVVEKYGDYVVVYVPATGEEFASCCVMMIL